MLNTTQSDYNNPDLAKTSPATTPTVQPLGWVWLTASTSPWTVPTPAPAPVPTPPVTTNKSVEASSLTPAKWYNENQVWIPWVNMTTPTTPATNTWVFNVPWLNDNVSRVTPPATTPIISPTSTTPASTTPTTTSTTWTTNDVNNIVDTMFPKWQYSDDERKAMQDALASKNPAELTAFMAQNESDKANQTKQLLDAYRTTRDYGLQAQRTQTLNDQRVTDLTEQYDQAIKNQSQKMEADANNMWVVLWTAWRLQSRNMINATTQMLNNNRDIYNQLVSNKDRDIQRLWEDLKYAQTMASNEYNDKINDTMKDMLKNISSLDATWDLNTALWLTQARSFVDKTVSDTLQHQSDYYSKLSYISQRFDTYNKEAQVNAKVDDNTTKLMNDWYLYNASWIRVKDENWQPLKVQGSTLWTLLTKDPISLNDWTKAFVYQNPDWTTRIEKITWTEAPKVSQDVINNYAKLLNQWTLKASDLKELPAETQQAILSQAWTLEPYQEQITPYQQAQLDLDKQKMNNMTPLQKAQYDLDVQKYWLDVAKFKATQWEWTSTTTSWTSLWADLIQHNAQSIADYSIKNRWTSNLQCWQLVNDYIKQVSWTSGGLWDTYTSKINALNKLWTSDTPQVWWIFVLKSNWDTWHTWIIQSVSDDWKSIQVLEANRTNKSNWTPPTTSIYAVSNKFSFSQPIWATSYKQSWLLANTDFNPKNKIDADAKKYLDLYLQNWKVPTPASLWFSVRWWTSKGFQDAQQRAGDLYYAATWNASLPNMSDIKWTMGIINSNKKLENSLNVQEWTVMKNFKLAIDNIDKWWINQSAPKINDFINYIQNQWLWNPETAAYLAQNQTVANEIWSLLALKNAWWTTVSDKLEAANLIPKWASEDQQKLILKQLMQEAENASWVIKWITSDLYSQVDPLETQPNNPNRLSKIPAKSNKVTTNTTTTWTYKSASWKIYNLSDYK